MPTMPREFIDVLTNRLADYSGRDWREVRSVVRDADDRLAVRMADLMLDDVRQHVGEAHREYQSARRRFVDAVGPELRAVSPGVGTRVQQLQQARADAERVFAIAVDVADPVAVAVEAPRAKEVQRAAQVAEARAVLRGLIPDRMPTEEQVGEWLTQAEQGGDRREFVAGVGSALLEAAGDENYEPRTNSPSARRTLGDGVARAWVRQRLPEVTAALGRPMEPGDEDQLPYGFQGEMADGLAQAISERTGRPHDEVLDRLCAAGDLSLGQEDDQWTVARQLLVPDAALEQVGERERARATAQVRYRMLDTFMEHYGYPDEPATLSPHQVGAEIATAATTRAEEWHIHLPEPPTQPEPTTQPTPAQTAPEPTGLEPTAPEQAAPEQAVPTGQDPALDAAVKAAFVPGTTQPTGRPAANTQPAPGTSAPGTPARPAARQPGTRPGERPGSTPGPRGA
ncbi:hypothetical protein GCM10009804_33490 [Kribbella hippodromi]|uniref:DUF222 domain-containing protein n=1 Tax=Kribbella hippodromi TaxID=434347 RepID=A0ABN2DDN9_9ACTN